MPNIRVVCPACSTTLELDARHAGQEVECGSCLQVFVANPPPAAPPVIRGVPPTKPAPRRGPPPRRPARDDDDDYPRGRYDDDEPAYRPASGLGTAALVLGILSVVAFCCWPVSGFFGVLALVLGAIGRGNPMDRPSATAGLVLGIVGMAAAAALIAFARGDWQLPL